MREASTPTHLHLFSSRRIEYLYLHVLLHPIRANDSISQVLRGQQCSSLRPQAPHLFLVASGLLLWSLDQIKVQGKAAMGRGQERVSGETEPEAWRTEGQVGGGLQRGPQPSMPNVLKKDRQQQTPLGAITKALAKCDGHGPPGRHCSPS